MVLFVSSRILFFCFFLFFLLGLSYGVRGFLDAPQTCKNGPTG